MNIRVLGCHGAEIPGFRTTCFMINGSTLVDAGAVTSVLSVEDQAKISNILVTHSHLDHVKDIPLLADNVIGKKDGHFNIISSKEIIKSLKDHLFNGEIWPDFSLIPTPEEPVVRFVEIEPEVPFDLDGMTIKAVEVSHTVPTLAYIINGKRATVVIAGDTGPTETLWKEMKSHNGINALFLETSFPDNMEELAGLSGHLTPKMMMNEIKKSKLKPETSIYIYHMKPNFIDTLKEEISLLDSDQISLLELDQELTF